MSGHTFEAGEFSVTYRVAKHHTDDGEPHEDWAEITDVAFQVISDEGSAWIKALETINSIPKFMDHLTELANEDLKERQRDNHYED